MAIRDIIKGQPDDAEVQVGEQRYKVSDLRSELHDPEQYISREEYNKLSANHQALGSGLLDFLNKAAASTTDQQPQPNATPDVRTALRDGLKEILFQEQGYNYDKDQYVGPAMSKAEERAYERAMKDAAAKYDPLFNQMSEQLKQTTTQAILAEENSWFRQHKRDLPKRPDGADYSLQDLRTLALRNNIVDDRKYPDYDTLLDRLTEPERRKTEVKDKEDAAYKAGYAAARKEAGQTIMDVPGRGYLRVPEQKPAIDTKGKTADQIIREGLQAAWGDDELFNLTGNGLTR
jgi:hypothetical protein